MESVVEKKKRYIPVQSMLLVLLLRRALGIAAVTCCVRERAGCGRTEKMSVERRLSKTLILTADLGYTVPEERINSRQRNEWLRPHVPPSRQIIMLCCSAEERCKTRMPSQTVLRSPRGMGSVREVSGRNTTEYNYRHCKRNKRTTSLI